MINILTERSRALVVVMQDPRMDLYGNCTPLGPTKPRPRGVTGFIQKYAGQSKRKQKKHFIPMARNLES